jgi:hypothetical protein
MRMSALRGWAKIDLIWRIVGTNRQVRLSAPNGGDARALQTGPCH